MAASPLILGESQRADLARLRQQAASEPVDVLAVLKQCKSPQGRAEHLKRMEAFTIPIPTSFMVTFSVENGHPPGPCRHLSMSVLRRERVPTPEAVWMIAEELGFQGGLERCAVWQEDIGQGDVAINVVQPITGESVGTIHHLSIH
jgi:hypothetical protein